MARISMSEATALVKAGCGLKANPARHRSTHAPESGVLHSAKQTKPDPDIFETGLGHFDCSTPFRSPSTAKSSNSVAICNQNVAISCVGEIIKSAKQQTQI
jgi:hypothetical protein